MATLPVTAMCNTSLRLSDASETDEQHPVSHHDIVALEMEMITAAIRDGSYSSQAYTDASWSHVQSEGGCNVCGKVKTKAPKERDAQSKDFDAPHKNTYNRYSALIDAPVDREPASEAKRDPFQDRDELLLCQCAQYFAQF